ncbi:MAG: biotin/lipoyl-binding protein [Bacillota bacterium]
MQSLNLSFKNPGTVKTVAVEQGQEVKEGQLLMAQEDLEQLSQLASARANLRSARARLAELENGSLPEEIAQLKAEEESARVAKDTAQKQLERLELLVKEGAATQKELDDARSSYAAALSRWQQAQSKVKLAEAGSRPEQIEQARASVEAAEAQVRLAESNQEATRLLAPFDGIVAEVNATVGQRVTGVTVSGSDNTSRPLLSVVSKKLRVRAQVNEADIGQVAVGQKAAFVVNAFPDKKFLARVSAVSPQAITVSNVQFYEVLLEIEGDTAGLKAGMPCNVEIVKEAKSKVLSVPRQALSFARSYASARSLKLPGASTQNQGVVLVLNKGQLELRPVQTGISNNQAVEITAGLTEGELVVTGQKGAGTTQSTTRTTGSPFFPGPPPGGGGRR